MSILAIIFAVFALLLGYFAAKPKHLLALTSSDLDLEPEAQGQLEATMRWLLATTAVVCLVITSYFGYFGKENEADVLARERVAEERIAKLKKYSVGSAMINANSKKDKKK